MAQYANLSKFKYFVRNSSITNSLIFKNAKISFSTSQINSHNKGQNNISSTKSTRYSELLISKCDYYKKESHRNNNSTYLNKSPLVLCFLGFSLRDYLGTPSKEEEEKNQDSELILMIKKGAVAFYNREYDKSESLLHIALKYAQEISDEKAITYIYDILANLAYQRQDFAKAEKLFKSVLQRYASEEGSDLFSNEFIAVSLKIANCYAALKDLSNSIKGFHYCISGQAEKLKMVPPSSQSPNATPSAIVSDDEDSLVLYAMSLEQYAGLVASVGHYPTALLFLKEALRICIAVNGEDHLQTAVLRNGMGAIMAREEKYSEASKEIEIAIDIAKTCIEKKNEEESAETSSLWNFFMGSSPPQQKVGPIPNATEENALSNLATFYINLGSVKLLNGELKEAERCCTEGEIFSKRALDKEANDEANKCLQTVKETMEKSKKKKAEAA